MPEISGKEAIEAYKQGRWHKEFTHSDIILKDQDDAEQFLRFWFENLDFDSFENIIGPYWVENLSLDTNKLKEWMVLAIESNKEPQIRYLISYMPYVSEEHFKEIFKKLVRARMFEQVIELIKQKPEISRINIDEEENTLLHCLAKDSDFNSVKIHACIKFLFENIDSLGIDISKKNKKGESPFSVFLNHAEYPTTWGAKELFFKKAGWNLEADPDISTKALCKKIQEGNKEYLQKYLATVNQLGSLHKFFFTSATYEHYQEGYYYNLRYKIFLEDIILLDNRELLANFFEIFPFDANETIDWRNFFSLAYSGKKWNSLLFLIEKMKDNSEAPTKIDAFSAFCTDNRPECQKALHNAILDEQKLVTDILMSMGIMPDLNFLAKLAHDKKENSFLSLFFLTHLLSDTFLQDISRCKKLHYNLCIYTLLAYSTDIPNTNIAALFLKEMILRYLSPDVANKSIYLKCIQVIALKSDLSIERSLSIDSDILSIIAKNIANKGSATETRKQEIQALLQIMDNKTGAISKEREYTKCATQLYGGVFHSHFKANVSNALNKQKYNLPTCDIRLTKPTEDFLDLYGCNIFITKTKPAASLEKNTIYIYLENNQLRYKILGEYCSYQLACKDQLKQQLTCQINNMVGDIERLNDQTCIIAVLKEITSSYILPSYKQILHLYCDTNNNIKYKVTTFDFSRNNDQKILELSSEMDFPEEESLKASMISSTEIELGARGLSKRVLHAIKSETPLSLEDQTILFEITSDRGHTHGLSRC